MTIVLFPSLDAGPCPSLRHTKKQGGTWTWIGFYWAFVFLPFADFVVGVDTFNKRDEEYQSLRDR